MTAIKYLKLSILLGRHIGFFCLHWKAFSNLTWGFCNTKWFVLRYLVQENAGFEFCILLFPTVLQRVMILSWYICPFIIVWLDNNFVPSSCFSWLWDFFVLVLLFVCLFVFKANNTYKAWCFLPPNLGSLSNKYMTQGKASQKRTQQESWGMLSTDKLQHRPIIYLKRNVFG